MAPWNGPNDTRSSTLLQNYLITSSSNNNKRVGHYASSTVLSLRFCKHAIHMTPMLIWSYIKTKISNGANGLEVMSAIYG